MSKVLMDLALGTVRVPFHGTCLVLPFAVHPWITQMLYTLSDLGAEENLGFNYPQTVAFSIIMWSGTWLCTTKTSAESYWFNPEIPPQNNYRSYDSYLLTIPWMEDSDRSAHLPLVSHPWKDGLRCACDSLLSSCHFQIHLHLHGMTANSCREKLKSSFSTFLVTLGTICSLWASLPSSVIICSSQSEMKLGRGVGRRFRPNKCPCPFLWETAITQDNTPKWDLTAQFYLSWILWTHRTALSRTDGWDGEAQSTSARP